MFLLSKGRALKEWSDTEGILSLHTGKNNAQKPIRIHLKLTSYKTKPATQFIISLDKYEIKKLVKYAKNIKLIK